MEEFVKQEPRNVIHHTFPCYISCTVIPLPSPCYKYCTVVTPRETREGWPLLTCETEVNGDSKRANEMDPSLVGLLGLSCRYKRFLFCLGCFSRSSTKYFFLSPYTISITLFPSPSKLGRQPCWVACLLVCGL